MQYAPAVFANRLRRDERGSALFMTALAMMTMVIAAGAAVDLSRGHALQSHVGSTLDAATLAAANASINVPCDVDTTVLTQGPPQVPGKTISLGSWVNDQGTKYFNMNLPSQYLGSTAVTGLQFVLSPPDNESSGGTYVTGSSNTTLPNSFLQIAGQSGIPVSTCSQVHIPLNGDLGTSPTATSPHVHGDPTTGVYTLAPGTPNTVAIATGSTERLRVDGDGNMSLGAAPDAGGAGTGSGPKFFISGYSFNNTDNMFFQTVYDAPDQTELRLSLGDNANQPFGSGFSGDAFVIGGTAYPDPSFVPRFTFTGHGELGVGTSSPLATVDVVSTSTTMPALRLFSTATLPNAGEGFIANGASGNGASGIVGTISIGGNGDFNYDGGTDSVFKFENTGPLLTGGTQFASSVNSAPLLTMLNSGNIGVGTDTPKGNLDVENATNNATLCLNGSCTTTVGGASYMVSFPTLNTLQTTCPTSWNTATTTQVNGSTVPAWAVPMNIIPACNAACNRFCNQGKSGTSYSGGTLTEWNGEANYGVCSCVPGNPAVLTNNGSAY